MKQAAGRTWRICSTVSPPGCALLSETLTRDYLRSHDRVAAIVGVIGRRTAMILNVNHTTTYPVRPAGLDLPYRGASHAARQRRGRPCCEHELTIDPAPDTRAARKDYFGNDVTTFTIRPAASDTCDHRARAWSRSAGGRSDSSGAHAALGTGARRGEPPRTNDTFDAFQFIFESPRVKLSPAFAAYAQRLSLPGRPLLEAARRSMQRIFTDFKYDQGATTVTTPVEEAFESRQGVCQDFAHVMIACLRSLGLPALYVSGYLRSSPDSIGAAASHAWVSVFCAGFGWLDFDPTND